ncbi:PAS domain-containing protein [Sesbania bispinosa]|nr:PAS domain-containing protein [Sesbania bispinosa]
MVILPITLLLQQVFTISSFCKRKPPSHPKLQAHGRLVKEHPVAEHLAASSHPLFWGVPM